MVLLIFPLRSYKIWLQRGGRHMSSQWELLQMDCKRNTKLILNLFHYLLRRMQNVCFKVVVCTFTLAIEAWKDRVQF